MMTHKVRKAILALILGAMVMVGVVATATATDEGYESVQPITCIINCQGRN